MQFNRHYLIISDKQTATHWKQYLVARYGEGTVQTLELPAAFFENPKSDDWFLLKQYFNRIVAYFNRFYNDEKTVADMRNLVVFIPVFVEFPKGKKGDKWNPLLFYQDKNRGNVYPREILFSWLVLAFPEVRFVFLGEKDEIRWTEKKDEHGNTIRTVIDIANEPRRLHLMSPCESPIEYIQKTDYLVLFDPAGLRDVIREMLKPPKDRHPGVWRRKLHTAVVLEDEMTFSFFCGYTAFRNGCKTWMLQNYRQAENLLQEKNNTAPDKKTPAIDVSLEDLRLGFLDKEDGDKLSHLVPFSESENRCRSKLFPRLSDVPNRYIITYGDAGSKDNNSEKSLSEQVDEYNLKNSSSRMTIRYKPLTDIRTLGKQTNLYHLWRKTREQNADEIKKTKEAKSNHSAEGIVLDIAEILFGRAKKLLREEKSIQDLIHAALLALEAKELLGGKTPTISLELLDIQHQAEVLAECRCYGTDYSKRTVNHRIREIRKEVKLTCEWYRPESRKLAELSARSKIVGGLSKIFSDAKQIEEHEAALIETRYLSGRLFVHHNHWALLFYPFRLYFEYMQRSLLHNTCVVMAWFFLFLCLWHWYVPGHETLNVAAYSVFNQFWDRSMPPGVPEHSLLTQCLRFGPFLIGITHILVLISNVHSRIQRK